MEAQTTGQSRFNWQALGDVTEGRAHLGPTLPVAVYRLMQYTLRDVLTRNFDEPTMRRMFVEAGRLAGRELCRHMLDTSLGGDEFIAQLKQKLQDLKIGLLRVEKFDLPNNDVTVTIAEDLDCSGLPVRGETICDYDEGFLAGIMEEYTGHAFEATETDCWASGDRVCRFVVKQVAD